MEHTSRLSYEDDAGLRAEMDAVARMTREEVHDGLRRLGVEPTLVLPWELRRLLDGARPVGSQARAKPGLFSSAAEAFAVTRSRLRGPRGGALLTAFMLLLTVMPYVFMTIEVRAAGGLKAVSVSRIRDDTAARAWVSPAKGDDAGPCSQSSPCKTLSAAMKRARPGGEIGVLRADGSSVLLTY